ncbi:anthranilate phosphoribosyltransferase [Pigmentibacter ruber]|uniref:anthranilate phosphoribosyltransferase n=1 Tax=Pigmentibacter ruber TaxID=2683196 RepID=UPI00131E731D|nr:anthranilate phosphoribosyltransferase [Pigmentibacter ruber]
MIIDKNFSPIMEQVFAGRGFSIDEAEALTFSMIDGTLSDVRIAAVLTGFRFLPVSEEIIIKILKTIKTQSAFKTNKSYENLVDCSGTGGDRITTLNIMTTSALIAAAAGAKVAKFTGAGNLQKANSLEVLQLLNIFPAANSEKACEQLEEENITILSSKIVYPSLKHLMDIRKTLGFKTIIDLIIPLANPLNLSGQYIGVFQKDYLPLFINCLKQLKRKKALVVHGEDGLDEISVCSATYISKLDKEKITHEVIKPTDFGLPIYQIKDLLGKDLEYNSKVLIDTLQNKSKQAIIDAVSLNAAATLWCADKCNTLQEGLQLAKETIRSGRAFKILESWKNKTH